MKYELFEPKHLRFLYQPIENREVYNRINRWQFYFSWLVIKVDILRLLDRRKHILNLIKFEFLNTIKLAQKELLEIRKIDIAGILEPFSGHEVNAQLYQSLKEYIDLGIVISDEDATDQERITYARQYIYTSLLTIYEYNHDRISECFKLDSKLLKVIAKYRNLCLAFYFSELLSLIEIGIFDLEANNKIILIYPSEDQGKNIKRDWFSKISENQSNIASLFSRNLKKYQKLVIQGDLTLEKSADIINECMDRVFSIDVEMLSESLKISESLKTLKEIVLFSLCIELAYYSDIEITESYFRNRTGIRDKTLDTILGILANSDEDLSISSVRNFVSFKNGIFRKGMLDFKYGLRKLTGMIFRDSKFDPGDFKGALGKSFEVDYVLNYLHSLNYFGFEAYGELNPDPASEVTGYDIDLILEDKKENIYYFIQVKYWFSALPAYLSEKITFFNSKKLKKGVLKQLCNLRSNIEHESVQEHLRSHGITEARKNNSRFILLHNIPYLNFYEFSGIIFYEWNMFRNILQSRSFLRKFENGDTEVHQINHNKHVSLDKPLIILDDILEEDSSRLDSTAKQWEYFCNTYCYFKLGRLSFETKLF